jgi:hypothetical protein
MPEWRVLTIITGVLLTCVLLRDDHSDVLVIVIAGLVGFGIYLICKIVKILLDQNDQIITLLEINNSLLQETRRELGREK